MITTSVHRLERRETMALTLRENYRRFWWLSIICVGPPLFFFLVGDISWIPIALILIPLWPVAPYLRAWSSVRTMMKSPLAQKSFYVEFDEREMRTMFDREIKNRLSYSDFTKVCIRPEGLQLWVTSLTWTLVPRRAFASESEFQEAAQKVDPKA